MRQKYEKIGAFECYCSFVHNVQNIKHKCTLKSVHKLQTLSKKRYHLVMIVDNTRPVWSNIVKYCHQQPEVTTLVSQRHLRLDWWGKDRFLSIVSPPSKRISSLDSSLLCDDPGCSDTCRQIIVAHSMTSSDTYMLIVLLMAIVVDGHRN